MRFSVAELVQSRPGDASSWLQSWNSTQGFWSAVQGVGTLIAALAALLALVFARSQLKELIRSNNLLAASNDAMTESNVALARPYVVVDFEFQPAISRRGGVFATTVAVKVENVGRTPASNLRLTVDPPFPVREDPDNPNWAIAVQELNKMMDGTTVIRSLTNLRNLVFYLDEAEDIMASDDLTSQGWAVVAEYEDASGRKFSEKSVLELSHWRRAMVTVDPMYKIAKGVQNVADEIRNKK